MSDAHEPDITGLAYTFRFCAVQPLRATVNKRTGRERTIIVLGILRPPLTRSMFLRCFVDRFLFAAHTLRGLDCPRCSIEIHAGSGRSAVMDLDVELKPPRAVVVESDGDSSS